MRAFIFAGLTSIVVAAPALAQFTVSRDGNVKPDSIATRYKLDFAIPDAPAFTLLKRDQSSVLRPGTVREFAAQVSKFVSAEHGLSLPREFAVEFSPAMLIGGSTLSLSKYQRSPALYRLRLSAATERSSVGFTAASLGLRVALIDKVDLRTDPAFLTATTELTTGVNRIFADQVRERGPRPGMEITLDDLTPERKAAVEGLIEQQRKRVTERRWNADILDVAMGSRGESTDTTGKSFKLTEYAAWLTYGKGFGGWGQLLLGARTSMARDSVSGNFKGVGSAGARLYAGTNKYKVFLEGEGELKARDNEWLLNGGGEARLITGGWIQFGAGVRWVGSNKAELVGSLTFKLGVLGL
ncbi:MAG: hypothetical protein ABI647_01515 [Gemmatimonadota bacterium]